MKNKTQNKDQNKQAHKMTGWDLYNYRLQFNKISLDELTKEQAHLADFANSINWK